MFELIYFIIGCITGVSMGVIGIGAGLITMPLLILAGLTIKQSVAIIMVMQLLPQSLPGVINYKDYIIWLPTLLVILGSIFGIWFGSHMVKIGLLDEDLLCQTITVFLFVSSIYFYIYHCKPFF